MQNKLMKQQQTESSLTLRQAVCEASLDQIAHRDRNPRQGGHTNTVKRAHTISNKTLP
eukprot:m.102901 g.102901  ORF g.102901 m.102901 type:complete len:58 (-) comp15547_c0_seq1:837-1010(-)